MITIENESTYTVIENGHKFRVVVSVADVMITIRDQADTEAPVKSLYITREQTETLHKLLKHIHENPLEETHQS